MNFANVTDWTIPEGTVNRVTDSLGNIIWQRQGSHDYSQDYFFIEDISGSPNTLTIKKSSDNSRTITVYKSTDQVNWTSMGSTSTSGISATIPANGKLYLRCTTTSWGLLYQGTYKTNNNISTSGRCNVGGNIMSLIKGSNFSGSNLDATNSYAFSALFYNNTNIVNACNLVIPSYIPEYGFDRTFQKCSSLITVPEFPAISVATGGYFGLFGGCSSLTTPPALPATTLAAESYSGMFSGCTSLTSAPALPATDIYSRTYMSMFFNCTSLITPPVMSVTNINGSQACSGMFRDCTSLTTAPVLNATTLADSCYQQMFYNATSLNSVTIYANDISATDCLKNWLYGVAQTGTFHNLGTAAYPSGASGIPSGWTQVNS